MRRVLAAVLLALLALTVVTETAATTSIYADIEAASGIHRTINPTLVTLAQKRSAEIVTDFSHNGWPGWTAEVIAWNSGYSDPLLAAVQGWRNSPEHWAILSDPYYTDIGCGWTVSGSRTYIACELIHTTGPAPTATPAPSTGPRPLGTPQRPGPVVSPPKYLPNTATR